MGKPIVIWRSENPRCFKRIGGSSKLKSVWYYSDKNSWMQVEIMEDILDRLNKHLVREHRKLILFMDNATVHPESLPTKFSNIYKRAAKHWMQVLFKTLKYTLPKIIVLSFISSNR